ncbi:hypothetical protein COT86_00635 [Candidatus Collierbacteria bacterium CG10_big_fil_rev_8_21_14_0_10_43_36]|uniref:Uncharacterized protein n=2 Tax=Candidatus Collieribacteriota TaxID=1752725 RepID=A0A2H0DUE2_9BACT|nr:hypothetical protein [Candidatus Parcubacteria bacterium]PIP85349.1 MAG: hypothetical protein COW83_04690 [Candidatus Collierbacteria bacterium CG22_combo_CG10-13_8_21_14_all_43_12]PIS00045.1 MAG: hypothetical protein COT86_00635 [Candidatus Collierbacteria bacterium CG10_big_fil_rev_8_21_14_0_10_43_36]PIZ24778.1 MAG: hypothetical protein COY48_01100 [Candidatus Collierbacteria bacterium CG_4_10_14_0_8_um_filter_43_86]
MDKKKWEELANKFKETTDKMGMRIDSGIFDLVVTLNALDFPTSASCWGHLERGVASPWLDFQPKLTPEIQTKKEEAKSLWAEVKKKESEGKAKTEIVKMLDEHHKLEKEVNKPMLLLAEELLKLLNDFYKDHSNEAEVTLVLRKIGNSAIRLESQGSIVQEVKPQLVKEENLLKYRSEMEKFSEYIKKDLISNK